jgi:hypothetical protein
VNDPARWQPVQDLLLTDPCGPLAQGLSTPWRLTLAAIIYEVRDPATGAYLHNLTDLTDHDAFFDLFYDEDLRFDFMLAFANYH